MKQPQHYAVLCPGALAFAFGMLALFAALAMGTPATFGMGSMMWGTHDAVHYGPMGIGGFGLVTVLWTVAVGALGGAITAWTYNAIVGEQIAETSDLARQPSVSRPVQP
jgi:hypothetical protein